MPNYCENDLTIRGSYKAIENVIKKYTTSELAYRQSNGDMDLITYLDFERINPTPKKEDGEIIEDWYNWRLANWGTKWNLAGDGIFSFKINQPDKDDDVVELTSCFNTAWTPPYELLQYLSNIEQDIKIEISFYEPGCAFGGRYEFEKGETTYEEYEEYCSGGDNSSYYGYLFKNGMECMDLVYENVCENIEDEDEAEMKYGEIKEAIDRCDYNLAGDIYQKVLSSEM